MSCVPRFEGGNTVSSAPRTMTTGEADALLRNMRVRVPSNLIAFGRALADAGHGPAVDGWPYFLERSEKWAGEFVLWTEAGRPSRDAADFGDFVDALEATS